MTDILPSWLAQLVAWGGLVISWSALAVAGVYYARFELRERRADA